MSDSNDASVTKKSLFLELPLEVRNKIYKFALERSERRLHPARYSINIKGQRLQKGYTTYKFPANMESWLRKNIYDYRARVSALLHVNKQIRQEAFPAIIEQNCVILNGISDICKLFEYLENANNKGCVRKVRVLFAGEEVDSAYEKCKHLHDNCRKLESLSVALFFNEEEKPQLSIFEILTSQEFRSLIELPSLRILDLVFPLYGSLDRPVSQHVWETQLDSLCENWEKTKEYMMNLDSGDEKLRSSLPLRKYYDYVQQLKVRVEAGSTGAQKVVRFTKPSA